MSRVHDEAIAARELIEALRAVPEVDAEAIDLTLESETNIKEALSKAIALRDEAELLAKQIDARVESMELRASLLRCRVERIETEIEQALELLPSDALPLRLPEATVTLQETGGKVIIPNDADVPDEWCKVEIKRTPRKGDILKALRAKQSVPGATLSNKTRTLRIKR